MFRRAIKNIIRKIIFGGIQLRDRIQFPGRCDIYVNVEDHRGRDLLDKSGVTQAAISILWWNLVKILRPAVALDVGANYGEISLPCRYPVETKLFLFEPNPYILPVLNKSVGTHQDADRIEIFPVLVSDQDFTGSLTINKLWSGTSSALGEIPNFPGGNPGNDSVFEVVDVAARSLQSVLKERELDLSKSILLKVDVEGYEGYVFEGIVDILERTDEFAIITEFSPKLLDGTKFTSDVLFSKLLSLGRVFIINSYGSIDEIFETPVSGWNNLLVVSRSMDNRIITSPLLMSLKIIFNRFV